LPLLSEAAATGDPTGRLKVPETCARSAAPACAISAGVEGAAVEDCVSASFEATVEVVGDVGASCLRGDAGGWAASAAG